MFSDYTDAPRSFWKGLLLALALGGTAWLGGVAFAAFVGWYAGRIG